MIRHKGGLAMGQALMPCYMSCYTSRGARQTAATNESTLMQEPSFGQRFSTTHTCVQ